MSNNFIKIAKFIDFCFVYAKKIRTATKKTMRICTIICLCNLLYKSWNYRKIHKSCTKYLFSYKIRKKQKKIVFKLWFFFLSKKLRFFLVQIKSSLDFYFWHSSLDFLFSKNITKISFLLSHTLEEENMKLPWEACTSHILKKSSFKKIIINKRNIAPPLNSYFNLII
jgi:hypothetical protein